MDDLEKKYLQDILTAIEEIESFFGDRPKLFEDFSCNLCLRRAVERNIEIIGEAMNRILKVDKRFLSQIPARLLMQETILYMDMIVFLLIFFGVW